MRRMLRGSGMSAGFAAVVIGSLALGIGANAAMFSLLDAVFFRMLPVRSPEQLVRVAVRKESGFLNTVHSYPLFLRLRDGSQTLTGALARTRTTSLMHANGADYRVNVELVSANYFEVLGLTPALGRLLSRSDDAAQGDPVCVISDAFWRSRLGAEPQVVGRTIRLNGRPFTVIGVAPRGFHGVEQGHRFDVAVPLTLAATLTPVKEWDAEGMSWLSLLARLQPGVTSTQAEAESQALLDSPDRARTARSPRDRLVLSPAQQGFASLRMAYSQPLLVLIFTVALVFAIAMLNIFNLFMARLVTRSREIGIRLALGAGRVALLRQFMTETVVLTLCGGAVAILAMYWMLRELPRLVPEKLAPMLQDVAMDGRLIAFTMGLSLLVGCLLGAGTWLASVRIDALRALRGDLRAPGPLKLRRILVFAQVAIAAMLLAGALGFGGTLRNLRSADLGFSSEGLVLATFDTKISAYDGPRAELFYRTLLDRTTSLRAATAASLARIGVLSGEMIARDVRVPGYTTRANDNVNHFTNRVTPGYFRTMDMPLLLGRDFGPQDIKGAQAVAIINEKMAQRYWPSENPIGKHFFSGKDFEVVGVVGSSKYGNLRDPDPLIVYMSLWQADVSELTLHVRTTDPDSTIVNIQAALRSVDPAVPLVQVTTMQAQIDGLLLTERVLAAVSSALSGLALALSLIGLYGTMAYSVGSRIKEFGVRVALGARRTEIIRMVLKEAGLVVALGTIAGVGLAAMFAQYVTSLLYDVRTTDAWLVGGLMISMALVAIVGAALPAWKASSLPVVAALRHE